MQLQKSAGEVLQDIQNEPDHRQLTIDRVGVKNLRCPVQIRLKNGTVQPSIATVTLTVELSHRYKGTHMSRFIEVLNTGVLIMNQDGVRKLLADMHDQLDATRAQALFELPFFMEKRAPVSQRVGLMDYSIRLEATSDQGRLDLVTTVIVPVTTLCPCSKAISINGAHNQRGLITFSTRSATPLPIEDLIALAESSASSELYSLLKRPDEKAVTERAFANPVFVEDLVRDLAAKSERHSNITWYRIEAENFESIHNHNAYAMIEKG